MTKPDTNSASTQQLTAFFDSRSDADAAIARVSALGVAPDAIRIVDGEEWGGGRSAGPDEDKGFFDKLADFLLPDEERHTYAEGLNRGGYLVSISTTMENRDRVVAILDDAGTVDMKEREAGWRADGWKGFRTDASVTGHITGSHAGADGEDAPPAGEAETPIRKR